VKPAGGVTAEAVTRMRETLAHRGPDDAGLWVSPDGVVGLGHRRLSVLDLSERGRQPMTDRDGRAIIVYNGEVYNFAEIRRQLEGRGVSFVSDTDTEVILQAYLAWGRKFVDRLEGMFAIAIWDTVDRSLLLVRDRLGIKPLCYAETDGGIVFGSEIRAVLASGAVSRDLSPEAAWDFFSYGYVPTPATIYRRVRKLPPATMLTFKDGQAEMETYWQPAFECLGDGPETASRRITELIDESVESYLVADVPTGSYLSGGVDSSVVTQRAASVFGDSAGRRLGGGNLNTFTIGFDVQEHSEVDYARAAAAQFGTEHTELIVSREMAGEHNETIIDLFDEPFAASSTIPMAFLSALARRKVTVALCGEGGDETFGGYSWYAWWQRFRQPSFWKSHFGQATRRLTEAMTGHSRKKWLLPALESVELYAQLMGAVTGQDKTKIFSRELADHLRQRDGAEYFRRYWRDDLPPMARMQYVDLMTFLPDLNLTRADRTSMRVSLELRVPLLNHRLVEYAVGLPAEVRNPGGQLKGLFKQAMADRLSEDIRTRKKKGFSAPVKQWLDAKQLCGLVRQLKTEQPELSRAWLNENLEKYARRVSGSRAYKLWVFLDWIRRHGTTG
jgi:asparagine synthase (glutamine-hydrolysing)